MSARVSRSGEVVQQLCLKRLILRRAVRELIRRARAEGGGSYRDVAPAFRIEGEHQKLFDFLKNHRLRVKDRAGRCGMAPDLPTLEL